MSPEKIKSFEEHLRCPVCGDKVFIVGKGWQKVYDGTENDPVVFCSDMGHWAGHVSECKIASYPTRVDALEI